MLTNHTYTLKYMHNIPYTHTYTHKTHNIPNMNTQPNIHSLHTHITYIHTVPYINTNNIHNIHYIHTYMNNIHTYIKYKT